MSDLPENLKKNQLSDYGSSVLKALVGQFPVVGPILAEIVSNIIPNQRIDRIVVFLDLLAKRLNKLEKIVDEELKEPQNLDIFEDGCLLAVRSTSNERMEHIVNLVATGITADLEEKLQHKKLLSILDNLNDIEILLLYAYGKSFFGDSDIFKKNPEIMPALITSQSPQKEFDAYYLQQAYRKTLVDWGLLREKFRSVRKGEYPEFDLKTGKIKASGHEITPFGIAFLSYIGLQVEN